MCVPQQNYVSLVLQIYNDRRLFFGGGPGIVPGDNYGSAASTNPNADRRNSRSRGMLGLIVLLAYVTFLQ